MNIEQIYTGCLAHGAYYIVSNGEAAIIDPLRETEPYLDRARRDGAKIRYIFETHFHADFVSGHLDLARKTGATIVYGPGAKAEYAIYAARDGEEFPLGNVRFRILHTPGHTLESACFLLLDETGREHALFSGDTLFLGDVGRPDLAVKSNLSREDLAGMLYDSLQQKILPLPDHLIVYPGHGAGSACGKNMSTETVDTLGHQKATNYALRSGLSKEQFTREVLEGQVTPPQYFFKNAAINKLGYETLDAVRKRGTRPLGPHEFAAAVRAEEALVLDTRSPEEFAASHIPGAIFIGIDGAFAPWVGALITDLTRPIAFVAPEGREGEVVNRLSRVGYDATIGFLMGGMQAWKEAGMETATVRTESAGECLAAAAGGQHILDVRKAGEYERGHLEAADWIPLDEVHARMDEVEKEAPVHVHCAGGYRSMIFISILQANGYSNLINVNGGFVALEKAGAAVVQEA